MVATFVLSAQVANAKITIPEYLELPIALAAPADAQVFVGESAVKARAADVPVDVGLTQSEVAPQSGATSTTPCCDFCVRASAMFQARCRDR